MKKAKEKTNLITSCCSTDPSAPNAGSLNWNAL